MMLTAPLLSKSSSFFGSLLHKFRQVKITKSQKQPTTTNNTIKNTNNNNTFTPTLTTTKTNNAADTAISKNVNTNITTSNLLKTNEINASRPALLNANNKNNINQNLSTTAANLRKVKTNEEKIGLPPPPKKPLTPFFRFMQEHRSKVAAENPKLPLFEVVKKISKQWFTVDLKTKERLESEYKHDQQLYVEQRAKYYAKVTPEQKAEIVQIKKDKKEAIERRKLRRRIKDLGRPKRPGSAFFRFVKDELTSKLPNQPYREWHDRCSAKWARLSDTEKEGYVNDAKKEMEAYKVQIRAWEEKMLRMGNKDVVRVGHQIDPPEPKKRIR